METGKNKKLALSLLMGISSPPWKSNPCLINFAHRLQRTKKIIFATNTYSFGPNFVESVKIMCAVEMVQEVELMVDKNIETRNFP
jgi:hypothetical protein